MTTKISTTEIDELRDELVMYDIAYRKGDSLISDSEYDEKVEKLFELSPDDEYFSTVARVTISKEREKPLPIPMFSMHKIKTVEAYKKWLKSKGISDTEVLILTPKFDGASLAVNEKEEDAFTRGDGINGQDCNSHIKLINFRKKNILSKDCDFYSFGEVIMKRKVFEDGKFLKDDGTPFSNPRNLVAGKINDEKPHQLLKNCDYLRYGMVNFDESHVDKNLQLKIINELNTVHVPYILMDAGHLSKEFLHELFKAWNTIYELDGIIVEVNDAKLCEKLGRERNGNPCYARAYKGNFEDVAETEVVQINCEVSKRGYLKPVVEIVPVKLNGAMVTNPTGYNYKFIKEQGIGPGAIVRVIRSGMVIPKIIKTISKVKVQLPTECPACKSPVEWNETGVELCCTNDDCISQRLKKIIAFFKILKVDNVGEGICEQFYDAGYDTVEKILKMSKSDMKNLDRFGERNAEKIYTNIQNAITDVPLHILQHASGCFVNLGSTKLISLIDFDENTSIKVIKEIEGFSDISAKSYLTGIKKFNKFIENLPVKIKTELDVVQLVSEKYLGWNVVFTKIRDKNVEKILTENGAIIQDGIKKDTTHLVVKEKGGNSAKEVRAEKQGVPIYELDEFKELL